jgi:hypothetical protein
MLRTLFVAVVLLGGCSRSREPGADHAPPLPASASSPSTTSPSTTSPSALTCRTLQSCTDGCNDAACAEACVRRLTTTARPAYTALQTCVVPACADVDAGAAPCRVPGSFACKMCVLSRCAALASACMTH